MNVPHDRDRLQQLLVDRATEGLSDDEWNELEQLKRGTLIIKQVKTESKISALSHHS